MYPGPCLVCLHLRVRSPTGARVAAFAADLFLLCIFCNARGDLGAPTAPCSSFQRLSPAHKINASGKGAPPPFCASISGPRAEVLPGTVNALWDSSRFSPHLHKPVRLAQDNQTGQPPLLQSSEEDCTALSLPPTHSPCWTPSVQPTPPPNLRCSVRPPFVAALAQNFPSFYFPTSAQLSFPSPHHLLSINSRLHVVKKHHFSPAQT